MPEARPDFRKKQLEFSNYIRDPKNNPAPADVKKQRMDMYRELFYNNIDSFLSSNFPVLRKILDDHDWHALAQDFFAVHPCRTPYFAEIPEEFIDYLQNQRGSRPEDPPFLLELAHYEWVEMALSISQQEPLEDSKRLAENPLDCTIRLSPLAWPLAYQYPVHRISPDYQPEKPPEPPTFLLVYRERSFAVKFLEITPVTYQFLQLLRETQPVSAAACLQQLARESRALDLQSVVDGGAEITTRMASLGIIGEASQSSRPETAG